jgi:hypothetical protein
MQAHARLAVFVPGMIDEFLDLLGVAHIDLVDRGQVAVDDRAARQVQLLGIEVVGVLGDVAIGSSPPGSTGRRHEPVAVEAADGDHVRDIDVVHELDALS